MSPYRFQRVPLVTCQYGRRAIAIDGALRAQSDLTKIFIRTRTFSIVQPGGGLSAVVDFVAVKAQTIHMGSISRASRSSLFTCQST